MTSITSEYFTYTGSTTIAEIDPPSMGTTIRTSVLGFCRSFSINSVLFIFFTQIYSCEDTTKVHILGPNKSNEFFHKLVNIKIETVFILIKFIDMPAYPEPKLHYAPFEMSDILLQLDLPASLL